MNNWEWIIAPDMTDRVPHGLIRVGVYCWFIRRVRGAWDTYAIDRYGERLHKDILALALTYLPSGPVCNCQNAGEHYAGGCALSSEEFKRGMR